MLFLHFVNPARRKQSLLHESDRVLDVRQDLLISRCVQRSLRLLQDVVAYAGVLEHWSFFP